MIASIAVVVGWLAHSVFWVALHADRYRMVQSAGRCGVLRSELNHG